jgi:FKBP-type peptidyl-prolyl cis-trans isomerase
MAFCSIANAQTSSSSASAFTDDRERESYALGMYLGQGWKKNGLDVDIDMVARALKDSQSGGPTVLNQQQMMDAISQLRRTVQMNQQKIQAEAAANNQEQGAAFLAQNKAQPGVMTLPDGLEYKIITDGTGPSPSATDVVTVNYKGTFLNGTEFDGSDKAGHPAQFPVNRVIPGWTEALQKMKVGSKWELYIPSDLAYGPSGHPPVIGPDEVLVFEVELLSISAPPAPAPPRQPLTSDIIRVPSAEEMKNGAQVETIKASDLQKMQAQQASTN